MHSDDDLKSKFSFAKLLGFTKQLVALLTILTSHLPVLSHAQANMMDGHAVWTTYLLRKHIGQWL